MVPDGDALPEAHVGEGVMINSAQFNGTLATQRTRE